MVRPVALSHEESGEVAVSVEPSAAVPLSVGAAVDLGATRPVWPEVAVAVAVSPSTGPAVAVTMT